MFWVFPIFIIPSSLRIDIDTNSTKVNLYIYKSAFTCCHDSFLPYAKCSSIPLYCLYTMRCEAIALYKTGDLWAGVLDVIIVRVMRDMTD